MKQNLQQYPPIMASWYMEISSKYTILFLCMFMVVVVSIMVYYHTAYGETKNVCTFLKPLYISLLSLLTIKNGVRTPPIDAPIHHKRLVFLKYVISKKLSVIINVFTTTTQNININGNTNKTQNALVTLTNANSINNICTKWMLPIISYRTY